MPKTLVEGDSLVRQQMAGYRLAALSLMADLAEMAATPCFDTFIIT